MSVQMKMTLEINLSLPTYLFEQSNLPADLVESVADKPVNAKILAEEIVGTRRVEHDDCPLWIDPEGNYNRTPEEERDE